MTRIPLLCCFLILVTTAAFATDGVIEINQAKALAGGVTTGDTAGFPASINTSGSYRLTSNLDVRAISGAANLIILSISADDVTIDFNGFAIIGPVVCSGTPTNCVGASIGGRGVVITGSRMALKNGTVQGAGSYGIVAGASTTISNMQVESNGNVGVFGADQLIVENSTVSLNGSNGIYTTGVGSNFAVIRNNVVSGNAGNGIFVGGSAVVQNNTVGGNSSVGIYAFGPSSIVGNTIIANGSYGISNTGGGGHALNVLASNNGGAAQINGGVSMGINVCNGAACP
jgi:hypothetical protein